MTSQVLLKIEFQGDLASLDCANAVINGNVQSNVDETTVTCGNVKGDVDAMTVRKK